MKTIELLALAMRESGIPSDYALAAKLNTTRQVVSHWRTGRSVPSPLFTLKLAHLAGVDPIVAIAGLESERAEMASKPDQVSEWAALLSKLSTGTAAALALGLMLGAPAPADASARPPVDNKYTLSKARRGTGRGSPALV